MVERGVTHCVSWSAAFRPLPGQLVSGDSYAVIQRRSDVLVAVVDGLGHGQEAAEAARLALDSLGQSQSDELGALLGECSRALRRTRGAAISVARFRADASEFSWAGVGNVEGVVFRSPGGAPTRRERMFVMSGVVGHNLPKIAPRIVPIDPGDLLVVATDGLDDDFADSVEVRRPLPEVAQALLERHARSTDDALVLVARFEGKAA